MQGTHIFTILCPRKHISSTFDDHCYFLDDYYSKDPHPAACCPHRAFPARYLSLNSRYLNYFYVSSWLSFGDARSHCCMSGDGNPLEYSYLFQKRIDGRIRKRRSGRDTYDMASRGKRILHSGRSAQAMLNLFTEEYYSYRHKHQKEGGNGCYARRKKHVTPSLRCTYLTESDIGPESESYETQFDEKEEIKKTGESAFDCKDANKKFDFFSEGHCKNNSVCVTESHADGIDIGQDEENNPRTKPIEAVGDIKNNKVGSRSLPSVRLGESIEHKLIEKTDKGPGISKSIGELSDLGGSSKVHRMDTTYSRQRLRREEDEIISENTLKKELNNHLTTSLPSSWQYSDIQKAHEEISHTIKSSYTSRNNEEVTNLATIQDMRAENYERGEWEFQHIDSRSDIKLPNVKRQISGSDPSKVHSPVGDCISLSQVEETPLIPADISNLRQSTSKDGSISQDSLNMLNPDVGEKGHHVKEGVLNLQWMVSNLQSQSTGRSRVYTSLSNWSEARDTGFETSQCQSTSKQDQKLEFFHEQQQGPLSPGNVLGSTCRFDKSSRSYVDEFMEKVNNQLPTSEIRAKQGEISSSQYRAEGRELDEHTKIHSYKEFGAQGLSVEQRNNLEFEDPKALESTFRDRDSVIRKSSRSLWNIISYIFGTPWSSHGISRLPAKNDKSSFSVNPNHTNGKRVIDEQKELFAADQGDVGSVEADTFYSPATLKSHSSTKGMSMASCSEIELQSSDSVTMGFITTPIYDGISDIVPPRTEENLDTGSNSSLGRGGSVKQIELPPSEGKIKLEEPNMEREHAELKRRKLQRSKQVLNDRFEEWEEAYRLEKQQQLVDEVFMREALLEAKKAADSWEVPVGAVLVRDGDIIARGCNLVEDLRDSTAHAEMLCIREASKLLRTWRLAGATLYVTLEPCPMCAGAILQARIDTLVWGTPNKLLGADGSWIRLFPEGVNERNEERMDMPLAPIHPLHPKMTIRRGILAPQCADAMQNFFERRKKIEEPSRHLISHPSKFMSKLHDIFHVFFCL